MKKSKTRTLVINTSYGGFGLSEAAYKRLVELGVPVRKYIEEKWVSGRYQDELLNDGEVLFDRELTPLGESPLNDIYHKYKPNSVTGRYWETWLRSNREHPLLIQVVKELGKKANGSCADLKIVKIPSDVEYTIEEYDGLEHIAEKHKTWA